MLSKNFVPLLCKCVCPHSLVSNKYDQLFLNVPVITILHLLYLYHSYVPSSSVEVLFFVRKHDVECKIPYEGNSWIFKTLFKLLMDDFA